MDEDDVRIGDLKRMVNRIRLEATNLEKIIERKKKSNVLSEEEEYILQKEIEEKSALAKRAESEVRRIENERLRISNLSERGNSRFKL